MTIIHLKTVMKMKKLTRIKKVLRRIILKLKMKIGKTMKDLLKMSH